ncbi:DASH complex subunit Dad1-domain-containing protein [Lipomyces tetrasporus]|uniref:DASH complex subunit DAD1 n=1 Tax=Lipomyces tetrasporus TaxID=54092 RepID=A0AAD7VUN9_9ASCO|nr:DASH complex subunit Dad1-domain-containing protein [Lipomyces tetrasporus]KAJ8102653.1 DASH complex subunit Dad1-domain-containing protein [Lipomyces tetrasporus]
MDALGSAISTPGQGVSSSTHGAQSQPEKSYFEKQRDALVSEIAVSLEHVLSNINTLNRALEGAIAVGKEFESVSTLWSTFYDGIAHENHGEVGEEDLDEAMVAEAEDEGESKGDRNPRA